MRIRRRLTAVLFCLGCVVLPIGAVRAVDPAFQVVTDPPNDAVVRLTDEGANGPCNPNQHQLPDLIQMKLGRFAPTSPVTDLFVGDWSSTGGFVRFDIEFRGLVNPPGPLGFDFDNPNYEPFFYGPNPVFGWIELDMDQDADTGGELSLPQFRYLGNVARFGGKPQGSRFSDRVAEDGTAFDQQVWTPPYVDRSGEEFHLAFIGEDIDAITILQEKPGGDPDVFEEGEVWLVNGTLFHRAHGFEEFSIGCIWSEGQYMPVVSLKFAHNLQQDRTTVTLVVPLTNAASASMQGPGTPVEPHDGCPDNQNSVEEALDDLKFSATYASYYDRLNPDFQLLANWQYKNAADYLSPINWDIEALVGTAYGDPKPDYSTYIWTDIWPNPTKGDFNGDGLANGLDAAAYFNYMALHNGVPGCDDDGNPFDEQVELHDFARSFSLFDVNHDGIVDAGDLILRGDMDLDGQLTYADVDDFVQAILNPAAYQSSHGGTDPLLRGDMNGDSRMDGQDVSGFLGTMFGGVGVH